MARLLDFTLQCKILEESDKPFSAETAKLVSDELNQALLDLRQRGDSSSTRRPRAASRRASDHFQPLATSTPTRRNNTESFEQISSTTSRVSSIMDIAVDTVMCRVMFVYWSNGIHYTKCSLETGQDCPLQEMLRAISAKAGRPAQLCRVFSCDKRWGNRKEARSIDTVFQLPYPLQMDLHETGKAQLMDIPSAKPNRLNFIVDYVNTLTEDGRPAPFDLNEAKSTNE